MIAARRILSGKPPGRRPGQETSLVSGLPGTQGRRPMSAEENKLLVRRQFDEIWNAGNWATADELYAQEYVNHDPYNPGQGTGPEGFKQRVSGYRNVLHDFDLRIERQIAEGDMV